MFSSVGVRKCRRLSFLVLLLVLGCSLSTEGFINVPRQKSLRPFCHQSQTLSTRPKTSLSAKLWDRLNIEEDEEPLWYLLNCIAGLEIDLMRQCRDTCEDMPDAVKFVVPTERKTRSHGASRMVTEDKIKYPGYVFAKLRLCPEVYEAIQPLDLCRSWMGTVNRKGYKKLPPSPLALNEVEVENFGLEDLEYEEEEEEETVVIVDDDDEEDPKDLVNQEDLKAYLGLKVEDMVKVTKKGNFNGEDGIVRRLKDGRILVRFYTYGTMFEEWLEPQDVRVLSNIEILKGLSGPSQPVTQREFDRPRDRQRERPSDRQRDRGSPRNSRVSLRGDLMSRVSGNRGVRNRRRDRVERGDKFRRDRGKQNRDRSSRGNKEDSLSQNQRGGGSSRAFENAIEGDDDWSAFVSQPSPEESSTSASEEDSFFSSLMSDLSNDLSSSMPNEGEVERGSGQASTEDDFFASLTTQLSQELDTGDTAKLPKSETESADDDFFAALEAQLSDGPSGSEKSGVYGDSADEFFKGLEAEMASSGSDPQQTETDDSSGSVFADILMPLGKDSDSGDVDPSSQEKRSSKSKPAKSVAPASQSSGDLTRLTVPVLKNMLRERGLKVSGKKAELIERLKQP